MPISATSEPPIPDPVAPPIPPELPVSPVPPDIPAGPFPDRTPESQGQAVSGGMELRIDSTLPPVFRPNIVPLS